MTLAPGFCGVLGAILLGFPPARAIEIPEPDPCGSLDAVAAEYLEWELAGVRWQGGESPCLSKVAARRVRASRTASPADPGLLDPGFVLSKNRKLEIRARRLPGDLLEVKFGYLGKKFTGQDRGREQRVNDELRLKLNFGRVREEKGCAVLQVPPRHLVMREACVED